MRTSEIAVTTTPVLLYRGRTSGGSPAEIHLQNLSGVDIYVGGSAVTTGEGMKMTSSDAIWGPIKLKAGADLYGIVAAGSSNMLVLGDED